jgi:hypothetical protein
MGITAMVVAHMAVAIVEAEMVVEATAAAATRHENLFLHPVSGSHGLAVLDDYGSRG